MILYFEKGSERREIGQPKDVDDAWNMIADFCAERNFPIHYVRSWQIDKSIHYDVGSHSEFFILEV